jgi:23S rRNA (pseudouridine1915-N3)-methyltransferase
MKIQLLAVGKPRGPIADAIADYESRIRRYYSFEAVEVREEPAKRGRSPDQIREEEAKRLVARAGTGVELIALHRDGEPWTSEELARYLETLALRSSPGVSFFIGGAIGLGDSLLQRARTRLALSAFTLPHELARLVFTEQLYRAGTISRGEPYHKTRP